MLSHLMSKLNRQVHIFLASLQWQLGIIQAVSQLDTGTGRRAPHSSFSASKLEGAGRL